MVGIGEVLDLRRTHDERGRAARSAGFVPAPDVHAEEIERVVLVQSGPRDEADGRQLRSPVRALEPQHTVARGAACANPYAPAPVGHWATAVPPTSMITRRPTSAPASMS